MVATTVNIGRHHFFDCQTFVGLVVIFFIGTALIVAPLRVEVEKNPCEFFFGDFLYEGFFSEVKNSPVKRDFSEIGMFSLNQRRHFGIGIHKEETIFTVDGRFPSDFRLFVFEEITFAIRKIDFCNIVFGKKPQFIQYFMKALATQNVAFVAATHASESSSGGSRRLDTAFVEILDLVVGHWYDSTTGIY